MQAVALDPSAVVIRYSPVLIEKVMGRAIKEFRRSAHFGLSVWADVKAHDETDDDVVRRLHAVAQLRMTSEQRKIYVCRVAGGITDAGFAFVKDEEDEELPEHYCVDLRQEPTDETIEAFLALFPEEVKP